MDGYAGVRIIGGGDRVAEFEKLSNNYNGKLYAFDNVEVLSAGDRDPDGDDVSGMSASKQRKAAAEGDFATFRKGVPSSLNNKQAKELYNSIFVLRWKLKKDGICGRLLLSLIGKVFVKTLLVKNL